MASIRLGAQATPPRGPSGIPDPAATRSLHPAALTVVLLTERLPAEHAALPVRGTALELRAATALSRLWADRGETDRGTALLSPICDVLRDAGDTVDLRRARRCLAEWR